MRHFSRRSAAGHSDPGPSATPSPSVDRARRHLWVVTFAVLGALSAAVVFFSDNQELERAIAEAIPILPAEPLRVGLGALVVAFAIYVVDRERNLRKLSDRLTEERIESTKLATRLQFLTELQRERDTNAALLDGAADGVAVVDRELRVLRFNAAMEALTGIPAAHAIGGFAPAFLRFSGPDGRAFDDDASPLRAALAGESPGAGTELRLRVGAAHDRWVSATFSTIGGESQDRPSLVLVVLRDISEAKEMQALQRDFVSIVSHELRAPLTAIKGFAKTLLQRGDSLPSETRAGFLQTVNNQSDRLARLVDDLLQVSRIDARRLRMDIGSHDPAAVVLRLLEEFSPKWLREVGLDLPDDLPPVAADRSKLEEVLINLIDNAVKYSPEGSPVRIAVRDTGGEVEFSIEDRGAGISPEDAAKLFQKFQRLSTPATRDVGGTGLGLYIVKGLVDAMGGRVWIESAPGAGSTFAFTIPAAQASAGRPEAVTA